MSKRLTKTEKYMRRERKAIFTTTVGAPILKNGKGVCFTDIEGKQYLDFTSQISLANTGHNHPLVVQAIEIAAKSGITSNISADWPYQFNVLGEEVSRAALAEKLIKISQKIMPFRKRVLFEVSGATAVNAAMKMVKIAHLRGLSSQHVITESLERFKSDDISDLAEYAEFNPFRFSFLAFKKAFHGRHGEAQMGTSSKAVQLWGASSSCVFGRLDVPSGEVRLDEIIKKADYIIQRLERRAPVIGFIFEPIQGEGGFRPPDREGLKMLHDYLQGRGIYTIADEIQSGLGRSGKMFACEHFNIHPDMVLLSKSLAAGLPMGAVIADARKFEDLEPGMHSGSMHCSPVPCAASVINLGIIQDNILNSTKMGELATKRLVDMKKAHPDVIQEVRGLGLMIGIEFFSAEKRNAVLKRTGEEGLLLAPCGEKTIRFCPPIIINKDEMAEGLNILESSLL